MLGAQVREWLKAHTMLTPPETRAAKTLRPSTGEPLSSNHPVTSKHKNNGRPANQQHAYEDNNRVAGSQDLTNNHCESEHSDQVR
eukprot:5615240-Alexandrium_andersonii.AAC.1